MKNILLNFDYDVSDITYIENDIIETHNQWLKLIKLDNNKKVQKQIMELIPEIRKWYAFNNMKAVGEPDKRKRPWLSIIKHLLKTKYTIENKEHQFKNNEKWIKSPMYIFTKV